MNQKPGPDLWLYGISIVCTVLGLLAIWDAGYARAAVNGVLLPREFKMQAIFSVLAIGLGLGVANIKAQKIQKLAVPGLILSLILLILVEIPGIGVSSGGARRWIGIGPLTLQPAEFAKLGCIVFMAWALADRKPWKQPRIRNFADRIDHIWFKKIARGAFLLPVIAVMVLIEREPDMATAMVIAFSAIVLMVMGGVTWKSLISMGVVSAALVVGMVFTEGYRLERITNHSARWEARNIESIGFQTTQSEIALASGGMIGVGLGQGRAKHTLPAPTTDFILATIGEEFGLVGSMVVITLLAFLCWRLFYLGWTRRQRFDQLVLYGLSAWIGVQSATNIMMANGYFPPIGIPLPFFSYGGSSLLAVWMGIGVAQSILNRQDVKALEEDGEDSRRGGKGSARRRVSQGRRSSGVDERERVASLR